MAAHQGRFVGKPPAHASRMRWAGEKHWGPLQGQHDDGNEGGLGAILSRWATVARAALTRRRAIGGDEETKNCPKPWQGWLRCGTQHGQGGCAHARRPGDGARVRRSAPGGASGAPMSSAAPGKKIGASLAPPHPSKEGVLRQVLVVFDGRGPSRLGLAMRVGVAGNAHSLHTFWASTLAPPALISVPIFVSNI